ncbi:adenosine deaminase [Flavisolibacter nicotianae]|uniref:adenosine deaminase n=1 Tax=Flavisolibacter nicotianae TaxID=2364882 RepID=UPI000EB096F8|nr:adenosine deaminase [Flavisolibacter nicotianae]
MDYSRFPKIELHLHLDCSLSYDVVRQLAPSVTEEEYRRSFVAPAKCTDLADYISRAVKGIELMQTREQLRLVTLDLFQQLEADNVIYAEIRFAPLQHLQGGLTAADVVRTVNDAVAEGISQTGVEARLLLCTLRHYTEAQSLETVGLVEQFSGTCVAGFDIAADEAGFPIDNHLSAFAYAKEKGIPCTAHAGEAKGPESVRETLENFHPLRIGHGVRSSEDERLLQLLKDKNIHLEVCPTSNVQTNVYPSIEDHTVDTLFRSGVSLGINTDARTISAVTLDSEYGRLHQIFGWTKAHFKKCNLEAIDHAFVNEETKARLRQVIEQAYR